MKYQSVLCFLLICACIGMNSTALASGDEYAAFYGVDRSEALGTWNGYIGTQSRGATLLKLRLTLQTGLEDPDQPVAAVEEIDEEAQAAIEEARARTKAIREGLDPEKAAEKGTIVRSYAQEQAKALEEARVRRERARADRVEGVLEFEPLYSDGEIRIGLGGVPSVDDATGICEVVGYLDTHSGLLTIKLTRWVDRPKTDLLKTSELQLVIDPSEPVLFGEAIVFAQANSAFRPVIAWREGEIPEQESARILSVAYPNHYGGGRVTSIRRELSSYNRELESLERERPIDTIEADFASKYAYLQNQLENQLASNQSSFDKTSASYDAQEKDLDEQEAAGDLTESQLRRIESRRESIANRRVKLEEQLQSRNAKSQERYKKSVAELDERVAAVRAEYQEELAKFNAKREKLESTRKKIQRTITVNNEVVSSWINRIAAEYPEISADDELRLNSPKARHAVQNSLRDDIFVEIFGSPYDELTDFDMLLLIAYFDMRNELYDDEGEVNQRSRENAQTQPNRRRVRGVPTQDQGDEPDIDLESRRAQQDEQRKLLNGGAHEIKAPFAEDYEQNLVRLYVQRRTVNWIDRMRDELESIQPNADTFVRIDAIEKALALRTHILRPSEQEAAILITIAARSEHADATAYQLATRTVGEASGQEGIASMSYFWARQPALDRLVSDESRKQINKMIDDGLDLAIVDVAQGFQGRIDKLNQMSDPYEALALGADIYQDFLAKVGAAKRLPAAKRILGAISARRQADLLQVYEAVKDEILAAETVEEARRIASNVVTLPSDAETDPGTILLLSVSLRSVQLEEAALQALFSEREWSLLSKEHGRLDVPEDYSAPSDEEVRLATLRALSIGGGEVLDPSTCMHVVPGLGNLNVKLQMELRDVQVLSAEQRPDGGYDVMYTFRRRITPEGSLKYFANDDYWQGTLLLDMMDAFGDHVMESAYETFRLGPYGWYSSTLAARLDLASAMQPLRVLTAEKRDR